MTPYIDHYYVVEDLQKRGRLDVHEYSELSEAIAAYKALPTTQRKALGAQNREALPGSLDFVQCVEGKNVLSNDYLFSGVGWQCKEVFDVIDQIKCDLKIPAQYLHFATSDQKEQFRLKDGEELLILYPDRKKEIFRCFSCVDDKYFRYYTTTEDRRYRTSDGILFRPTFLDHLQKIGAKGMPAKDFRAQQKQKKMER